MQPSKGQKIPYKVLEPTPALAVSSPETYESDDNSSMSDVLATEPLLYMRLLF